MDEVAAVATQAVVFEPQASVPFVGGISAWRVCDPGNSSIQSPLDMPPSSLPHHLKKKADQPARPGIQRRVHVRVLAEFRHSHRTMDEHTYTHTLTHTRTPALQTSGGRSDML